jgi:hypothetical protein
MNSVGRLVRTCVPVVPAGTWDGEQTTYGTVVIAYSTSDGAGAL